MKSIVKTNMLKRLQWLMSTSYAPANTTEQFINRGDFGLSHCYFFCIGYTYRYCHEEMKALVKLYRDCLAGKVYLKPDVAQKIYAIAQGRIVPLEECKDITADELLPIHRKGFVDAFYLPELKDVPIETFFDAWDFRDRQQMFTPCEDSLFRKFCGSFDAERTEWARKGGKEPKDILTLLSQTYGCMPDSYKSFGGVCTFRYAALNSNIKSELIQMLLTSLSADKIIVDSDATLRIDFRSRPFITYARGFKVRRREQTYITARVQVDSKVLAKEGIYSAYGHRMADYTFIDPFEVREG